LTQEKFFDRDSSMAQGIFFDTSDMETSSRRMSAVDKLGC